MTASRVAALTALLSCSLWPASARAFDAAAEFANFSKMTERHDHDGYTSPESGRRIYVDGLTGFVKVAGKVLRDPARLPLNVCAPGYAICAGDVRLYDWGTRHGLSVPVEFTNRNGAVLSGHVWAAVALSGRSTRRMPAIVITPGAFQATERAYWWAAQTLARNGYVVLTFDTQGQGLSDTFGTGATFLKGFPSEQLPNFVEGTSDALDFLLSAPCAVYKPNTAQAAAKQARLVGLARANPFNPLAALVDPSRVGLAGHSNGAYAVSIVASGDHRVDAVVAWDALVTDEPGGIDQTGIGAGVLDTDPDYPPFGPRVPGLDLTGDYSFAGTPNFADPDPQAKAATYRQFVKAGVDAATIVIRGGTHQEFSYIPNPVLGATLRGIDLASWYTNAWFDKYLKASPDADRRLLTSRWRSDSAEAAVDPGHDGNMFSFYSRSQVHFRRTRKTAPAKGAVVDCADLRAGCAALVASGGDGSPAGYSVRRYRTAGKPSPDRRAPKTSSRCRSDRP